MSRVHTGTVVEAGGTGGSILGERSWRPIGFQIRRQRFDSSLARYRAGSSMGECLVCTQVMRVRFPSCPLFWGRRLTGRHCPRTARMRVRLPSIPPWGLRSTGGRRAGCAKMRVRFPWVPPFSRLLLRTRPHVAAVLDLHPVSLVTRVEHERQGADQFDGGAGKQM